LTRSRVHVAAVAALGSSLASCAVVLGIEGDPYVTGDASEGVDSRAAPSDGGSDSTVAESGAPGATRCVGNGVATCGSDDTWCPASPCTGQTCEDGGCVGVCAPGSPTCVDGGVATCNPHGQWVFSPCVDSSCNQGSCSRAGDDFLHQALLLPFPHRSLRVFARKRSRRVEMRDRADDLRGPLGLLGASWPRLRDRFGKADANPLPLERPHETDGYGR
jgi:hypothetical protein